LDIGGGLFPVTGAVTPELDPAKLRVSVVEKEAWTEHHEESPVPGLEARQPEVGERPEDHHD
jgi:hypothetical protein